MKTPREWAEYIYYGFPGSEEDPADEVTLIERAIASAVADEREACAKIAESFKDGAVAAEIRVSRALR